MPRALLAHTVARQFSTVLQGILLLVPVFIVLGLVFHWTRLSTIPPEHQLFVQVALLVHTLISSERLCGRRLHLCNGCTSQPTAIDCVLARVERMSFLKFATLGTRESTLRNDPLDSLVASHF